MIKVLIITNIPAPYRVDLFNHLIDCYKNYEFNILYSSNNEDNRSWRINDEELRNSRFLESKTLKIKNRHDYKYIHIPKDVFSVLSEINPDVIVASEYNPTICLAYIWAKLKRKRFINWSDGTLNSEKNINALQKKIRKIVCKNADSCIASSTKTKEALMFYGANEEKIFISFLTVDINKYLVERKKTELKTIISVGRLVEGKGYDLLFNALTRINYNYKLIIVGDGGERNNIENLILKHNLDKKVELLGFKERAEIVDLYANSDVFILTSKGDCFGLVINEAMCAGLPVIASKYADGVFDLIEEGKNGFIVDPYDKFEVAGKLEILLTDEKLNINMGNQAKNKVKCFSIQNVGEKFVEAIEYALKGC